MAISHRLIFAPTGLNRTIEINGAIGIIEFIQVTPGGDGLSINMQISVFPKLDEPPRSTPISITEILGNQTIQEDIGGAIDKHKRTITYDES